MNKVGKKKEKKVKHLTKTTRVDRKSRTDY
jgi:hypothetical protein